MKKIYYSIFILFVLMYQVGCTYNNNQVVNSISDTTISNVNTNDKPVSAINSASELPVTPSMIISPNSLSIEKEIAGNNNSNVIYGGRVVKDGDWIYFSLDSTNLKQDSIGICKMKSDGSNFSILINEWSKCLNISSEYIYYIKTHDGWVSGDIYRIRRDGTEETKILAGEYTSLLLIGNKLFFTCMSEDNYAYKLYKMNIDGTHKELFLNERCDANFLYSSGFVYTVMPIQQRDGSLDVTISKISINDSKQRKIIAHNVDIAPAFLELSSLYIYKNNIFFINNKDKHVYSINVDGTSIKMLNNIDVDTMVISESGKIYCFSWDLGTTLYSFDLDGQNVKKISKIDQYSYLIGIENDYLYFNEDWGEGNITNTGRVKIDGSNIKYLYDYMKNK